MLKKGDTIKNKWKGFAPTQYSIGITGSIIINAVPKSGWFKTTNVGIKAIAKGARLDIKFLTCRLLSERNLASVITITHLAISEGWKRNGNP